MNKSLHTLRTPLLITVAAAGLMLSACGKTEDSSTTLGEKVDSTVQTVEQKADATVERADQALSQAGEAVDKATDSVAVGVSDAVITASVTAALAGDPDLRALDIDVNTTAGRVALRGKAPNEMARARATELVSKVEGVIGVDNQLDIVS